MYQNKQYALVFIGKKLTPIGLGTEREGVVVQEEWSLVSEVLTVFKKDGLLMFPKKMIEIGYFYNNPYVCNIPKSF
jgi:hypothetical protein